jgi:hypothetical protein
MKTINLQKDSPSLRQLLTVAARESVLLVSDDGKTFIIEEADEFDREVEELGHSDRFMKFLEERSKEKGSSPSSDSLTNSTSRNLTAV